MEAQSVVRSDPPLFAMAAALIKMAGEAM